MKGKQPVAMRGACAGSRRKHCTFIGNRFSQGYNKSHATWDKFWEEHKVRLRLEWPQMQAPAMEWEWCRTVCQTHSFWSAQSQAACTHQMV